MGTSRSAQLILRLANLCCLSSQSASFLSAVVCSGLGTRSRVHTTVLIVVLVCPFVVRHPVQFCMMDFVSTSWKRKTRIIKLAICRQAVLDVMQFHARDQDFATVPSTFPALGWCDNLDYSQGNSEEQYTLLLSALSVPEPKTVQTYEKQEIHLTTE
eukprot:9475531-Pyramimonas_sp.AAC.1